MNADLLFRRARSPVRRALSHLLVLALLAGAILIPLPAAAQSEPGETDPAQGYIEWPDDEWFVARPIQTSGVQRLSIYEPSSDFEDQTELDHYDLAAGTGHDAVAVAAGHFLTATHESVLYAFRQGANQIGLRFFRPTMTDPIIPQGTLVTRYTGGTDFIDLAAGDLDGEPALDGDYRDEAIVAWASPGSGGKHPVSLTVLAFGGSSESAPEPTGETTASGSSFIDGSAISSLGPIRPVDNALSLAVGDFNTDGVDEVAVAYLSSSTALTIDIFRYEVTRSSFDFTRTLTRVGGKTVTLLGGATWNESLSLVAGDFDGDLSPQRVGDELALATSERTISGSTHTQDVRLRLFAVTCTDNANCSTSPNLTVTAQPMVTTLGAPIVEIGLNAAARKVQIVAGLFKLDPANLHHQQIAAAYTVKLGDKREGRVRIVDINSGLGALLGTEAGFGYEVVSEAFWLAAGGFTGARSTEDPLWSLVWSHWGTNPSMSTYYNVYMRPVSPMNLEVVGPYGSLGTYGAPTPGARSPIVAVDTDGDTMYLGAPVHMLLYDVVNLDFILQEPPKHAYWDPVSRMVVSVSRSDGFNITLKQSDTSVFSTKSTDSSDWSIGGSVSASAKATVGVNASVAIVSASTQASVGVTGKVAYDYQQHESSYNEGNVERTASFGGETNKDDLLVGRMQTLHIWRYRIYGLDTGQPNERGFYEIVIPSSADDLNTEAGGLNFHWYQPTHENGNILSYPPPTDQDPPDLGSFSIPCAPGSPGCGDSLKTVPGMLFPAAVYYCDGNTGWRALDFSSASGGGTERSSSHTMAENASVSASVKSEVKVGGKRNNVSMGTEFSAEAEFHNSNSWGSAATANFKTTAETGIKLNRAGCSSLNAYAYYPLIYQTTDGSIKATFTVDPLGSPGGREWWAGKYGLHPDLALNLPWRYYYSGASSQWGVSNWNVNATATRRLMRGFFVRHDTLNPVTNSYDLYGGAAADGETVRLEARVYNYAVPPLDNPDGNTIPAGAKVKFEAVPYDAGSNDDVGGRILIGVVDLPQMKTRQMTTAAINWNTTGMSGGTSKQYRIYVTLDPANTVSETYEIESQATQFYYTADNNHPAGGYWTACASLTPEQYAGKDCIDPAQNNEGYEYVTVVKTLPQSYVGETQDTDLSMDEQSLAVLDAGGNPLAEPVPARQGTLLPLRVTVHADEAGTEYANVLLFNGDPQQGGALIAMKELFVGNMAPEGNLVWFDWVPQTYGPHTLYAVVQETVGDKQPNNNSDALEVMVEAGPSVSFLPVVQQQ